jgi:uncharacterized membrane protein YiaA
LSWLGRGVSDVVAWARTVPRSLVAGVGAALALAALWVGLTALTGKTYHLAPGLIAYAPGFTVRLFQRDVLEDAPPRTRLRMAARASALGLLIVGAGWAVIAAEGIEPSATVFAGQPGGVAAEVVLAALVGALLGARRVARRPRRHRR